MKKNIGLKDSIIRILIGFFIIGAGLYFQSLWGIVGFVSWLSGMTRRCPVYSLLNISTNSKKLVTPQKKS